jgi:hypothetical protein
MTIRPEADDLIAFLDSLAKLDPVAMGEICRIKVRCNQALADHPSVQIWTAGERQVPPLLPLLEGEFAVGFLGILNGYLGTLENGSGILAASIVTDEKPTEEHPAGSCYGFRRFEEPGS